MILLHILSKNKYCKLTLPSTGGQGMVALVAAGICLMAAMAALMVSYMRKRRNA